MRAWPRGGVRAWAATRPRHAVQVCKLGTAACVDAKQCRARGLRVLPLPLGYGIVYGSIGPL